ncbi:MAG: Serine/threonine-protein kinase PknF [Lentisphaerae bacterium ADurb.BinA184]|nr:MAG: Serine/threonine-protein kinase PknF [Lentisphaerae bacterium ADurb.BinA184]
MRGSQNANPDAGPPEGTPSSGGPEATPQPTRRLPGVPRRGSPIGRLDRYVLLRQLGAGGFGAVYRARDEVADIEVALKLLPSFVSQNPDELASVRENFKLVAKLRHPHIANVLHLHEVEYVDSVAESALGVSPGDHLIVMDYVPGTTVLAWRRQFAKGRAPVDEALAVAMQVAEGLDYAHSRRIVHRDIKPGNVMITPDGEVRILDFGLAAQIRASMSQITHTAEVSGTPAYMSPEQWAGRPQGPASDQYGLAVLFYEMVAGAVPFASTFESNNPEIMFQTVRSEMPQPVPGLTRAQNRALLRALSKDPRDRFASCADFVSALGGRQWRRRLANAHPRVSHPPDRLTSEARPAAAWQIVLRTVLYLGLLAVSMLAGALAVQRVRAWQREQRESARTQQDADFRRSRIAKLLDAARAALAEKAPEKAGAAVDRALAMDPENTDAKALQRDVILAVSLAEVIPARSEAEMKWKRAQAFERGEGFGEVIDRNLAVLAAANMLYEAKEYSQALDRYRQLIAEFERVQKLDAVRQSARRDKESAAAARVRTTQAGADETAAELVAGAVNLAESAQRAFDGGEFAEASKLWITACAEFAKAEASAKGTQAIEAARQRYDAEAAKIAPDLLQAYGAEEWAKVKLAMDEATHLAIEGNWDEAVKKWNQARLGLVAAHVQALERKAKAAGPVAPDSPEGAALAAARAAQAVAKAEVAKVGNDWDSVLLFSQEALTHDAESERARRLFAEAQAALRVKTTIVAVVGDKEITGARVLINDEPLLAATPTTVDMEKGREYRVAVKYEPTAGDQRFLPAQTTFMADKPGDYVLRVVLERAAFPPDLVEVAGAEYALLSGLALGGREAQARQRDAVANARLPLEARSARAGIVFRLVPAGEFVRRPVPGAGAAVEAQAERKVRVSRHLYVSRSEITVSHWQAVMSPGSTPPAGEEGELPKAGVTWEEADAFCRSLCLVEGVPAGSYRLPTEAEWEYSCRAGTQTPYYTGETEGDLRAAAWYGASGGAPHPARRLLPNAWGLCDTLGNAWEWCADWSAALPLADLTDYAGPENGTERILRGGGWNSPFAETRADVRSALNPATTLPDVGFRIVRALPPAP